MSTLGSCQLTSYRKIRNQSAESPRIMPRNRSFNSSATGAIGPGSTLALIGAFRFCFPVCTTLLFDLEFRIFERGISAEEMELERVGAMLRDRTSSPPGGGCIARQHSIAKSTRASCLLIGRYPYPVHNFCMSVVITLVYQYPHL